MFSSIDMTQLTPEKTPVFQKLKSTSYHDTLIGWILYFFLGYCMLIKIISGLVKPGV